jgi:hypothetical protein
MPSYGRGARAEDSDEQRPRSSSACTQGADGCYDGISHVLLSPDDLVPILAMALLAGLHGPAAGRRTLFTLTGAWLVGGLAGFLGVRSIVPSTVSSMSFLVLGGLTAADQQLSPAVVTGLAGIGSAIFVVVALTSAFVIWRRADDCDRPADARVESAWHLLERRSSNRSGSCYRLRMGPLLDMDF